MSAPLTALIHGEMKESREKCATLPDENKTTLARFSQFVYTDDYTSAEPEIQREGDMSAVSSRTLAAGTRHKPSSILFGTLAKQDPFPQCSDMFGASDINSTFPNDNRQTFVFYN